MGLFDQRTLFIGSFPSLVKAKLFAELKGQGAAVVYVVTKNVNYVVVPEEEAVRASSAAVLAAIRYSIPIVSQAFIESCLAKKTLVDPGAFVLKKNAGSSSASGNFATVQLTLEADEEAPPADDFGEPHLATDPPPAGFEAFAESTFDLLRQHTLQRKKGSNADILHVELHSAMSAAATTTKKRVFRLWMQMGELTTSDHPAQCVYFRAVANAEKNYSTAVADAMSDHYSFAILSHPGFGSPKATAQSSAIPDELSKLIDHLYQEANHCSFASLDLRRELTFQDLEKAEALFAQISAGVREGVGRSTLAPLCSSYLALLPRTSAVSLDSYEALAKEESLLQVLRDTLSVSERIGGNSSVSSQDRYAALGCQLTLLSPTSEGYKDVTDRISANNKRRLPFKIRAIYSASRPSENASFSSEIAPHRYLFHGSALSNWLGICSRGLLLPKTVESSGMQRTDAGMLGAGLYFASDASTAAQYAKAGQSGDVERRLMMVAEVAVGKTKDLIRVDTLLRAPPAGYDSTRGVPNGGGVISDFADEEFAVYSLDRQRMRYIVDFTLEEPQITTPSDDTSNGETEKEAEPTPNFVGLAPGRPVSLMPDFFNPSATVSENTERVSASPSTKKQGGLLSSSGEPLPLRSIAVRGRIVDCLADVVIMQEYFNAGSSAIEAKYVFPLEDTASVYGFEAFIMGKHVIGVCKEKEQARKEYREAISKGHGAYLMEKQAEEDVFTVSVGNLPPGETCVIKVLYVAELPFEAGAVVFSLPAVVASTAARDALAHKGQDVTQTRDLVGSSGLPLDLEISIENAQSLRMLRSPTHPLTVKRTECRAVVHVANGSAFSSGLFVLHIFAESPNEPRLWVEEDGEHRCAMVSFFPSFVVGRKMTVEYTLLLDCSASMKKDAIAAARRALIYVLNRLGDEDLVNVVCFGSTSTALLPVSMRVGDARNGLLEQLRVQDATLGNTELGSALAPLLAQAGAAPSVTRLRNILLFSDGRVSHLEPLLPILQRCTTAALRLFCFGAGSDISAHAMRTLARWGGGAYAPLDYSSNGSTYTTESRISLQLRRCNAPGLSDLSVRWGLHEKENAEVVPARLFSIFSGDRQIVYAFTRATSAELSAKNGREEIKAVVSAAENARLRGRMLHRLAVRAMVGEYETGVYDDDFGTHTVMKEAQKAPLIARSLEYGIVTPWTSFVAIEERTEGEVRRPQPSLASLLERESVDNLPYLGWPGAVRSIERLIAALAAHEQEYNLKEAMSDDTKAEGVRYIARVALMWLSALETVVAEAGNLNDMIEGAEKIGGAVAGQLEGGAWKSSGRSVLPTVIASVGELSTSLNASLSNVCPEAQPSAALEKFRAVTQQFGSALEEAAQYLHPKEEAASAAAAAPEKELQAEQAVTQIERLLARLSSDPAGLLMHRDRFRNDIRDARRLLFGAKPSERVTKLRAQIETLQTRITNQIAAASASSESDKAALVAWVASKVPECCVRNLSWNWSSGVLLSHLIAALRPDNPALLSSPKLLSGLSREEACAEAMQIAERWLGVRAQIQPSEMALATNVNALASYVAALRTASENPASLPPPPPLVDRGLDSHHDTMMRAQDEVLDSLSEAVARQKQLAVCLGEDMDFQQKIIDERNTEIRLIEQSMCELSEVFHDVARMVSEQGEVVDSIESNVVAASHAVAAAQEQLTLADEMQRQARQSMMKRGRLTVEARHVEEEAVPEPPKEAEPEAEFSEFSFVADRTTSVAVNTPAAAAFDVFDEVSLPPIYDKQESNKVEECDNSGPSYYSDAPVEIPAPETCAPPPCEPMAPPQPEVKKLDTWGGDYFALGGLSAPDVDPAASAGVKGGEWAEDIPVKAREERDRRRSDMIDAKDLFGGDFTGSGEADGFSVPQGQPANPLYAMSPADAVNPLFVPSTGAENPLFSADFSGPEGWSSLAPAAVAPASPTIAYNQTVQHSLAPAQVAVAFAALPVSTSSSASASSISMEVPTSEALRPMPARKVRMQVEDVKDVMVQNIDKILERGEKIDLLVSRSEEMAEHSYTFKAKSDSLKKRLQRASRFDYNEVPASQWWLLVVRVRFAGEAPSDRAEDIRGWVGDACDAVKWGAVRMFEGGADLCGVLPDVSRLETVLQAVLKTLHSESVEVRALHPASEVLPLYHSIHDAHRSLRLQRMTVPVLVTLEHAKRGLPLEPTPRLLQALEINEEEFTRSCPSDWTMREWATVVATLVCCMRMKSAVSPGEQGGVLSELMNWVGKFVEDPAKEKSGKTAEEAFKKLILTLPGVDPVNPFK